MRFHILQKTQSSLHANIQIINCFCLMINMTMICTVTSAKLVGNGKLCVKLLRETLITVHELTGTKHTLTGTKQTHTGAKHPLTGAKHTLTGAKHILTLNIHLLVLNIHLLVLNIHLLVLNIHLLVLNIHLLVLNIHLLVLNRHILVVNRHLLVIHLLVRYTYWRWLSFLSSTRNNSLPIRSHLPNTNFGYVCILTHEITLLCIYLSIKYTM